MKKLFVLAALLSVAFVNANLKNEEDIKNDLDKQLDPSLEHFFECQKRCMCFNPAEQKTVNLVDKAKIRLMIDTKNICEEACSLIINDQAEQAQIDAVKQILALSNLTITDEQLSQLMSKMHPRKNYKTK